MEEIKDKDEEVVIEITKKERKSKQAEKIQSLEVEIAELNDKLLRNVAELENFKKRMQTERIQDRKYASLNLITNLLDPVDQLIKIVEFKTDNDLLNNFLIGFKMISDQIVSVLEDDGVKEIKALNETFDPQVHQAVEKVSIAEQANGINIEVLQKGFIYKDRLIRPAMVKVNEWSEKNGENK